MYLHVSVLTFFTAHNYLAGALTGINASVFLCPSELVKCRLQALREMQMRAERKGFKIVQLAPKYGIQVLATVNVDN